MTLRWIGLILFCFLSDFSYGFSNRFENTLQFPPEKNENQKSINEINYDRTDNETTVSFDPYDETTFHLFTRKNPTESQDLLIDDVEKLNESNFNESWPVRIVIHGWRNNKDSRMNALIMSAYLEKGDFNVIIVHWGSITQNLNYLIVTRAVSEVGRSVAELTKFLNRARNVSFDNIYLIGHSLGAHVAGFAGKYIAPEKYNTIFALDAARPQFENRDENGRLHTKDAMYVESIHTSIIDVGFRAPLGHASFYPNYSRMQRGCLTVYCNHFRAYEFFAESINTKVGFYGRQCDSFIEIVYRNCTVGLDQDENGQLEIMERMGGEPSKHKHGIFYLPTRSRRPFAVGIFKEIVDSKI